MDSEDIPGSGRMSVAQLVDLLSPPKAKRKTDTKRDENWVRAQFDRIYEESCEMGVHSYDLNHDIIAFAHGLDDPELLLFIIGLCDEVGLHGTAFELAPSDEIAMEIISAHFQPRLWVADGGRIRPEHYNLIQDMRRMAHARKMDPEILLRFLWEETSKAQEALRSEKLRSDPGNVYSYWSTFLQLCKEFPNLITPAYLEDVIQALLVFPENPSSECLETQTVRWEGLTDILRNTILDFSEVDWCSVSQRTTSVMTSWITHCQAKANTLYVQSDSRGTYLSRITTLLEGHGADTTDLRRFLLGADVNLEASVAALGELASRDEHNRALIAKIETLITTVGKDASGQWPVGALNYAYVVSDHNIVHGPTISLVCDILGKKEAVGIITKPSSNHAMIQAVANDIVRSDRGPSWVIEVLANFKYPESAVVAALIKDYVDEMVFDGKLPPFAISLWAKAAYHRGTHEFQSRISEVLGPDIHVDMMVEFLKTSTQTHVWDAKSLAMDLASTHSVDSVLALLAKLIRSQALEDDEIANVVLSIARDLKKKERKEVVAILKDYLNGRMKEHAV